jgi:hypothetical protein
LSFFFLYYWYFSVDIFPDLNQEDKLDKCLSTIEEFANPTGSVTRIVIDNASRLPENWLLRLQDWAKDRADEGTFMCHFLCLVELC